MQQQPKRRRTLSSSRQSSISERSSSTMADSSETESPCSNQSTSDLVMPTSLILSTIEKEILEIQSSVIYYNETLVPDLAASPIPSETISIPMDIWLQKSPKVLHHIIVTIVTCHRLACNGSAHGVPSGKDESQLADTLNRHRGRGLMQLQRILSDFWHGDGSHAANESQRKTKGLVTLVAVVMLLAQEVQMSATSLWSMHLEAARSLVIQMGGIKTFWSRAPLHQGLFTLYMMIDMMSPPTSPAWSINEAQQREYLSALPKLEDFERRIIASFQPCPLPVLLAIVRTNVLRAAIHRRSNPSPRVQDLENSPDVDEQIPQNLALTLASLLRFDPAAWARKVCTEYLHLSPPAPRRKEDSDEAAWTTLASAYQSSAVLYLLRSVQHTTFAKAIRGEDEAEGMLHEQRTKLAAALSLMCRDLSRVKASALWRFLSWPLWVHAYELVAWTPLPPSSPSLPASEFVGGQDTTALMLNDGVREPPKNVTAALRRLQRVAKRLGANSLFDGVELLEGVWRRRCEGAAVLGGVEDMGWTWDDGFDGRCVFIV